MSQPRSHRTVPDRRCPDRLAVRAAGWFGARAFVVVGVVLVVIVALSTHLLDPWPGYPLAVGALPGIVAARGLAPLRRQLVPEHRRRGLRRTAERTPRSNVAYFPGYPIAMWLVAQVVRNAALAGMVVTVVSGLGAVVLFGRWTRLRLDDRTTRLAVLLLVLYPFAWYLFGAVYADAFYLVAAIGAFLLVEGGHPVLAGLVGAVATATRPIGPALVLGLVLVVVERRGGFRHLRALRRSDFGVLLSFVGMVAWSTYQGIRWGNPLLFSRIEGAPGWNQAFGPTTWFKVTFFCSDCSTCRAG